MQPPYERLLLRSDLVQDPPDPDVGGVVHTDRRRWSTPTMTRHCFDGINTNAAASASRSKLRVGRSASREAIDIWRSESDVAGRWSRQLGRSAPRRSACTTILYR